MGVKKLSARVWDFFQQNLVANIIGGFVVAVIVTLCTANWNLIKRYLEIISAYFLMKTEIPNYILLALIACSSLMVIGVVLKLRHILKVQPWEKYTSAKIGSIRWRWDNLDFELVDNIRPFCPKCDFQLSSSVKTNMKGFMETEITTVLQCPGCGDVLFRGNVLYANIIAGVEQVIKRQHRALKKNNI